MFLGKKSRKKLTRDRRDAITWIMKKITITLDEEVARWAKIRAAQQNISMSRLVGEMLKEKMLEEDAYLRAREQFLSGKPQTLKKAGETYPRREELYEP
ncbi:MAG: DUF6364 family protein [Thermodesulfobacteriota bacterium]